MADKPRSALITGASRGIGRAIALRLAAAGHRVAVNYNTHGDEAEQVVSEIRAAGGTAVAVGGSVTDRAAVDAFVKAAEAAHGPIEILVNNAGIIADALFMRMKDDDFIRVIETNLHGTYYCSRVVIPGMVRLRWGRIINISSVVGMRGNAGQANYSASKAAIHGLTQSLAKEVATRNITVNVIAPGYVHTATSSVITAEQKQKVLSWVPMGRFGEPDEIAPLAAFLASEDARYITGDLIRVDGGMAI
ncbi:MAG: 3-oxoacyl-[acyl-carrier-protein] reductase [Dehalococcoidia bacterium]|nr:3-oxoacyl-[acyl-carrier-protein] reductase [Dehalococcoidia bacterium]MSQ34573.1 3-oxoacyl-[acyl-carrier-protein] reductase [Dehalococcoidia bacterium]